MEVRLSGRKRYASSVDVAKLAGVSQSAVSRTYKPGGSVAPETRSRVLAAAAALNYSPSLIPRIMLTQRSNLIAVVIGGMYNPFYAAVLDEFTVGLERLGHQALLIHSDSGHRLDDTIPRLASYRVDAIISPLAILSPAADRHLARLKIPTISFNAPIHSEWVSTVCCDNVGAARAMVDLFIRRGARRFGFVRGPKGSLAAEERLSGFREGLRARGLPLPRVVPGDFRYESGTAAGQALLGKPSRPDAVFCANDLMAMGLMDIARQRFGLRIPEDLMIAGFDDIAPASWSSYDLTTVVQDAGLMTQAALEVLKRALSDPDHRSERILLEGQLIERRSTIRNLV